ncbi:hypothetical protein sce8419 [Sorangium cellulosum So ce56]|uniref:Uncharacterized protein n=1 Tax=Sorangium cellulosum (strain So ce56) TaxID=448385 RepID=A9FU25_SORC5|nr:DUF4150 domain-containing protein [Sorangium cellulosum]CAN98589.1 hypothetical protein sce8419 [Sorangium cellulosum So ce56]
MSIPREGSRDIGEGIIVSTCPDVCKTPVGPALVPIPYSIYARQNQAAVDTATTVLQTGDRSHNMGSKVTTCQGDEPGSGLGVKSGTVGSVCEPKTYSPTVRIEGRNAIRHDDAWWMNDRNTEGKLIFVRDTRVMSASDRPVQVAFLDTTGAYTGTGTATTPGSVPAAGPMGAAARLNALLGLGALGAGLGEMAGQYYIGNEGMFARSIDQHLYGQMSADQRSAAYGSSGWYWNQVDSTNNQLSLKAGTLVDFRQMTPEQLEQLVRQPWPSAEKIRQNAERLRAQRARQEENARLAAAAGNVRVTRERDRPCNVGPYRTIRGTCEPGYQAHHIVPDYTLRYGTRAEGEAGMKRIPNFPSFGDGPAICLQGNAGDDGSEHWEAHGVDASIAQLGVNGTPPGTTAIGSIIDLSENQVVNLRRECEAQIRAAVQAGFAGVDRAQLGRTTIMPAVAGSPQYEALSTGMRPGGRY